MKEANFLPSTIRVPMPRRSLFVMYGSPRYDYEHAILREDISVRRVCITYRELTPTFMYVGDKQEIGKQILDISSKFWDHKTYYNAKEAISTRQNLQLFYTQTNEPQPL